MHNRRLPRLLMAAALGLTPILSAALSFAQVPPPVPALPDAERRTQYAISGSTCACAVNFALFGSGTDVDSWIEVWVAGTRYLSTDPSHGWALTSATGTLATIPRPITNAILTFTAVQTGTVQIVGANRPRRLSQFQENEGVPARNLNQVITDIVAQNRETWDKINDVTGRGFFAPPGSTGGIITSTIPGGVISTLGPFTSGHLAVWNGSSGTSLADAANTPITGRQTYGYTPVFDLASGLLGVNQLFTATGVTVPDNANYSDIRLSQTSGASNTYTIGAGAVAAPIYSFPTALSGSDATSNLYGGVFQATNAGPGTVKGVHAGCFGSGTSTGTCIGINLQIQPVATQGYSSGAFASLTTSGINDKAIAYGIESNGDRYQYGIATTIAPVSYNIAAYQSWMATGSSANARWLQLLNNAGTEISYISKLGVFNGPSVLLNGSSSGTTSVVPTAAASGVLTLPAATDTLVGKATTDTLTNKTLDTAGAGNVLKINGTAVTAVVGAGQAVLASYPAFVRIAVTGVNFNSANTDTAVAITLPTGITRYNVQRIGISNASASISTATVGVFTATGGAGQTAAANQAITVTATAADTLNNSMALVITNGSTMAYTDATLQIRVGTAQGSAATADVIITIIPLT